MPIGSYLVSFSVNRQYFSIIVTIDKYNIYSKKEPRVLRDARFRKAGDARVLENYIGDHYEGRIRTADLRGFTIY
jgi:SMC interacting uncharacterized protein involved in chromosome segregation